MANGLIKGKHPQLTLRSINLPISAQNGECPAPTLDLFCASTKGRLSKRVIKMKSLTEIVGGSNIDRMEKIALELGFKPDKYYSAKEKMFGSCNGWNIIDGGCVV